MKIHKGWFNESLPPFIQEYLENKNKIAYIHVDCNLYKSTYESLSYLYPYLQIGTILLFDDWLFSDDWEENESKAWIDLCKEKNIKYEFITFHMKCVLVKIISI